jgi:hypothetical protein
MVTIIIDSEHAFMEEKYNELTWEIHFIHTTELSVIVGYCN